VVDITAVKPVTGLRGILVSAICIYLLSQPLPVNTRGKAFTEDCMQLMINHDQETLPIANHIR